jgi:hypothetical protein
MNKKVVGLILAGLGLIAFISLSDAPLPLWEALLRPVEALFDVSDSLGNRAVDVSENMEPVQDATRRLLKPIGNVSLTHRH